MNINFNNYVEIHQEKKAVKEQSMYSFLQNKETKLMNRFINFLAKKGKKAKAQNLFYNSLKILLNIITKEKMGKTNIDSIKFINKLSSPVWFASSPVRPFGSPVDVVNNEHAKPTMRTMNHEQGTCEANKPNDSVQSKKQDIGGINNYDSKIFHIFEEAILNIQPLFEVKKVRVAGTTYQVPALISQKRQENKAMNWLIESTLERKKKSTSQSFEYCLAFEIHEAFLKQGYARQKRSELHKLAESNRAFSHFRWW
jgi:small subunit ribosomal protein S7